MAVSRLDPRSGLETPEECKRSEERDKARLLRVKLKREEIAADRDRFELTRDKVVFGFELVLAVTVLLAAAIVIALNPELAPVFLLSGGGLGSVLTHRQRKPHGGDG